MSVLERHANFVPIAEFRTDAAKAHAVALQLVAGVAVGDDGCPACGLERDQ